MLNTGTRSTGAGFTRGIIDGPGVLILLGIRLIVGVLNELEFGLKGVLKAGRLFSVDLDLGVIPNPMPSLGEASGDAGGRARRSCLAGGSGVKRGRKGLA